MSSQGAAFDRPFILPNLAATVLACAGLVGNRSTTDGRTVMSMQYSSNDPVHRQPAGTDPAESTPTIDAKTAQANEATMLARFRTALALDRTTLAWIRTALTSAAFGFGLIGVFRTLAPMAQSQEARHLHEAALLLAIAMVAIGMLGAVASAVSHWASLRKLQRGEPLAAHRWPIAITAAVAVAMLGLYALWAAVTA